MRLVQPGDSYKVSARILGRDPALKHHPTRTRHREQVSIPRRLRGVGGQGAVGAMIAEELLEFGEQVHPRHSLPLHPARVHGVGEADRLRIAVRRCDGGAAHDLSGHQRLGADRVYGATYVPSPRV